MPTLVDLCGEGDGGIAIGCGCGGGLPMDGFEDLCCDGERCEEEGDDEYVFFHFYRQVYTNLLQR